MSYMAERVVGTGSFGVVYQVRRMGDFSFLEAEWKTLFDLDYWDLVERIFNCLYKLLLCSPTYVV